MSGAVPERPRVFLDADAIVAGSASTTGASHRILRLSELGLIEAISSAQARTEVERVLLRKLPSALPAFRLIADAAIRWVDDPPATRRRTHAGEADPKDLPLLVAAIEAEAETLMTFNVRHYHPRESLQIRTPGQYIEEIRALLARLGH